MSFALEKNPLHEPQLQGSSHSIPKQWKGFILELLALFVLTVSLAYRKLTITHLSIVIASLAFSFPLKGSGKVNPSKIFGGGDIAIIPKKPSIGFWLHKLALHQVYHKPNKASCIVVNDLFSKASLPFNYMYLFCSWRGINIDAGCEQRQLQNKQFKVIFSVYLQVPVILKVLRITWSLRTT